MARRLLLPLLLAAAGVCSAAQQVPDAPAPQPSAQQSEQPPGDPSDQQDQKPKKKKGNAITRTLKRAAPDCINIGTAYCRDESKNDKDDEQSDAKQQPSVPQSQPTPRSAHADANSSSSRDTQIDLSPPPGDAAHPGADTGDVSEFHPWDPHRAAKDIEVGDFYFKRANYRAAESRYREALQFKPNDAEATFKLAEALDRQHSPEAKGFYEQYLKILPSGEFAKPAQDAIERLKNGAQPSISKK